MHLVEMTLEEKAEKLVWQIGFGLLELFGKDHPKAKKLENYFEFMRQQPTTTFEQMEDLYLEVMYLVASSE
jgi:hypothetical protein